MKILAFALVSLIALASCEDEENYIIPAADAGRYTFESAEIEFGFELIREYGIYKGINGWVTHPAITSTEGRDNLIVTYYRTDQGYREIKMRSHAGKDPAWSVRLLEVTFTPEGMNVVEIRISMPGQDEIVLTDQFIEK